MDLGGKWWIWGESGGFRGKVVDLGGKWWIWGESGGS